MDMDDIALLAGRQRAPRPNLVAGPSVLLPRLCTEVPAEFLRDLWVPRNHGDEAHIDECRQDKFDRIAAELSCSMADLLEPTEPVSGPEHPRDLSIAEAKLLRRIHRGENVSRTLSQPERQRTGPSYAGPNGVGDSQGDEVRLMDKAAKESP